MGKVMGMVTRLVWVMEGEGWCARQSRCCLSSKPHCIHFGQSFEQGVLLSTTLRACCIADTLGILDIFPITTFPFQFRRGFKKMVMRLGCSLVRMPPGGCTIEDYLRAVEEHINTQVQELCKQAYVWYSK